MTRILENILWTGLLVVSVLLWLLTIYFMFFEE
jgi:hypothetical protein